VEEFPHLVQMHKKYAADGLVAISINADDLEEKDIKERVNRFLTEKGATFTNVILDDKDDSLVKKLDVDGLPSVLVYGRDGKLAKHFKEGEGYAVIEPFVVEQLKKK